MPAEAGAQGWGRARGCVRSLGLKSEVVGMVHGNRAFSSGKLPLSHALAALLTVMPAEAGTQWGCARGLREGLPSG